MLIIESYMWTFNNKTGIIILNWYMCIGIVELSGLLDLINSQWVLLSHYSYFGNSYSTNMLFVSLFNIALGFKIFMGALVNEDCFVWFKFAECRILL